MSIVLPRISKPLPLTASRTREGADAAPVTSFSVRTASLADLKFVDSLQKKFSNEVGFLPRVVLEAHLNHNRISIGFENDEPAGYILVKEKYQGDPMQAILYQCAIEYDARRHLLGTALLEHALGLCPQPQTKLASAWVAQDIEANFFWEACGFTPIAARQGSKRKGRVHIFWQRKLDQTDGSIELTAPSSTRGGLMRQKRAVISIDSRDEQWKNLSPDDFPDVEETSGQEQPGSGRKRAAPGKGPVTNGSLAEQRRSFVTRAQRWMWLIINGVGRYLPVVDDVDVPGFMDLPANASVLVGEPAAACALPSSRIPGVMDCADARTE